MAVGKRKTGVHFGGGQENKSRNKRRRSRNTKSKTPTSLIWWLVGFIVIPIILTLL